MQTFNLGKHSLKFLDKGRGTPLLMIHGFPLTSSAWNRQVEVLEKKFRVIAPDLRGFGQSEAVGDATSMADFADDLVALMSHLDLSSVVVMGHSMGGYVALNLVTRFPEKIQGLILVGSKPGADSQEAAKKRHETAAKALDGGSEAILKDMAAKMVAKNSTNKEMIVEIEKLMRPAQPRGLANALRGMAVRPDSTPNLGHITAPTLLISGDADALIPCEESMTMAERIPKATLEIIPAAGHLVSFEKASEFNAVLTRWFTRFL